MIKCILQSAVDLLGPLTLVSMHGDIYNLLCITRLKPRLLLDIKKVLEGHKLNIKLLVPLI
jgi:hypothetical protein